MRLQPWVLLAAFCLGLLLPATSWAGLYSTWYGQASTYEFDKPSSSDFTINLSYDNGGFNTTVSVRNVSSGIYDVRRIGPEDDGYDPHLANSINTNRVEGRTYVGLAMSYAFDINGGASDIELFGAIDNVFNTSPPIAPGGGGLGGSNYPTNPVFFDTFGARYRAGVRFTY